MNLPRSSLLSLFLVLGGVGVGCGPQSQGQQSPELDAFAAEADAALEAESKADSPSTTPIVVGDIAPGAVVTSDISPARRLVGWTFRAEDAAAINASAALRAVPPVVAPPVVPTPPAGGPTVNMVLYRRTSCLGRWERVPSGSGSAIMATRLPGAGEYLLVSGARDPNATAQLSASFAADQSGVIADPAKKPFKFSASWLPADVGAKLSGAGIQSFSDLRSRSATSVMSTTGLSKDAVDELSRLSKWLDVPQIDYVRACALKRAGADDPAGYYRLSAAAQQALDPLIPWGSVPVDPANAGSASACVSFLPPSPRPNTNPPILYAATSPFIDWNWRTVAVDAGGRQTTQIDHVINSRPWWQYACDGNHSPPPNDPNWYPDPAQGWDVLAYRFGLTPGGIGGGPVGYMIFQNRNHGTFRLFVYLPQTSGYNELLANVSLVHPFSTPPMQEVASWSFPLEDLPPTQWRDVTELDAAGRATGTTRTQGRRKASFAWKHDEQDPWVSLHSGTSCLRSGRWLRAELPTLFDPDLYTKNRDASGRLTPSSTVAIRVSFSSVDITQNDLVADLKLDIPGSSVPSIERDPIKIGKDMFLSALSAGSASSTMLAYFNGLNSPWAGAAAGAGAVFGLFGGAEAPLRLIGVAKGSVTGRSYHTSYLPDFLVYLTGTYYPVWDKLAQYPEDYQRCHDLRIGAVGFQSDAALARLGRDPLDPRPPLNGGSSGTTTVNQWSIPVVYDMCSQKVHVGAQVVGDQRAFCGDDGRRFSADSPVANVGKVVAAPWAQVDIVNPWVELEATVYQPTLPHKVVTSRVSGTRVSPLHLSYETFDAIRHGGGRLRLRWHATVQPKPRRAGCTAYYCPGRGTTSQDWQYALDVTDRIVDKSQWVACMTNYKADRTPFCDLDTLWPNWPYIP